MPFPHAFSRIHALLLPLVLLATGRASAEPATGYYRFPSIHGDNVVFTAEGDLWRVSAQGGVAQRLTTHPGQETNASLSPDGKWIAFSAQYEGPVEAYVMPFTGGLPKRITFDGESAAVRGWTPDGRVLVSTFAESTLPNRQLVAITPANLARSVVPLAQADEGSYDEAGNLYFTRLSAQSRLPASS